MIERLKTLVGACLIGAIVLYGAFVVVGAVLFAYSMLGRGRITNAESPDGRYKITIDERVCGLDRNFNVLLWERASSSERELAYPGWDQHPGIEREGFVWSADSRLVALVGDKYDGAVDEARLPNDCLLYMVYDTAENRIYYNDRRTSGEFPTYSAEQALETFGDAILQLPPLIEPR